MKPLDPAVEDHIDRQWPGIATWGDNPTISHEGFGHLTAPGAGPAMVAGTLHNAVDSYDLSGLKAVNGWIEGGLSNSVRPKWAEGLNDGQYQRAVSAAARKIDSSLTPAPAPFQFNMPMQGAMSLHAGKHFNRLRSGATWSNPGYMAITDEAVQAGDGLATILIDKDVPVAHLKYQSVPMTEMMGADADTVTWGDLKAAIDDGTAPTRWEEVRGEIRRLDSIRSEVDQKVLDTEPVTELYRKLTTPDPATGQPVLDAYELATPVYDRWILGGG